MSNTRRSTKRPLCHKSRSQKSFFGLVNAGWDEGIKGDQECVHARAWLLRRLTNKMFDLNNKKSKIN